MNARAYVVMFSPSYATRQQVQDFLDTVRGVTYWYACMPYCVFVTATLSADELAGMFNGYFKSSNGNFMIMEANDNRQGWMPRSVWHLLSNPQSPRPDNVGR